MNCISNESCKKELSTLQKSLTLQLQSQQISLEEITTELQMGFTTLQDSLEEVHTKLDLHTYPLSLMNWTTSNI